MSNSIIILHLFLNISIKINQNKKKHNLKVVKRKNTSKNSNLKNKSLYLLNKMNNLRLNNLI
jgi:hypothetical protein